MRSLIDWLKWLLRPRFSFPPVLTIDEFRRRYRPGITLAELDPELYRRCSPSGRRRMERTRL